MTQAATDATWSSSYKPLTGSDHFHKNGVPGMGKHPSRDLARKHVARSQMDICRLGFVVGVVSKHGHTCRQPNPPASCRDQERPRDRRPPPETVTIIVVLLLGTLTPPPVPPPRPPPSLSLALLNDLVCSLKSHNSRIPSTRTSLPSRGTTVGEVFCFLCSLVGGKAWRPSDNQAPVPDRQFVSNRRTPQSTDGFGETYNCRYLD